MSELYIEELYIDKNINNDTNYLSTKNNKLNSDINIEKSYRINNNKRTNIEFKKRFNGGYRWLIEIVNKSKKNIKLVENNRGLYKLNILNMGIYDIETTQIKEYGSKNINLWNEKDKYKNGRGNIIYNEDIQNNELIAGGIIRIGYNHSTNKDLFINCTNESKSKNKIKLTGDLCFNEHYLIVSEWNLLKYKNNKFESIDKIGESNYSPVISLIKKTGTFTNNDTICTLVREPRTKNEIYFENGIGIKGENYIYTFGNQIYKHKKIGYYRLFDNNNKRDHIYINCKFDTNYYNRNNKKLITHLLIVKNNKKLLITLGKRGERVEILSNNTDITIKETNNICDKLSKNYCTYCNYSCSQNKIKEHTNDKHTIDKHTNDKQTNEKHTNDKHNFRNQIHNELNLSFEDTQQKYNIILSNINNYNLKQCEIKFNIDNLSILNLNTYSGLLINKKYSSYELNDLSNDQTLLKSNSNDIETIKVIKKNIVKFY